MKSKKKLAYTVEEGWQILITGFALGTLLVGAGVVVIIYLIGGS